MAHKHKKTKAPSTKHPNSRALVGVITNIQAGPMQPPPRSAPPSGQMLDPDNDSHPGQAICDPDMDGDNDAA